MIGRRTRLSTEERVRQADVWLDLVESGASGPIDFDTTSLRALADATRAVAAGQRAQAEAVASARRAGVPWSRIAVVLGVTRQGAKKRFGEPPRDRDCSESSPPGAVEPQWDLGREQPAHAAADHQQRPVERMGGVPVREDA